MIPMLNEEFMQRALLAGLLLGPVCAGLGVFVTARKMAFFSDTISHAALAGVALGFWWGFADPTIPMIGFSLMIAAALIWLRENTELLTDTLMALLLSGSVAFGIILLSRMRGYRGELHAYLFGDILAVGRQEIGLAAVLFVVMAWGLARRLNALALLTTNEDLAHVCGVPVRRLNYLFILVLTVTVAVSIRLLGIILVTSLLVIPPAAARNVSRNLRQQILFSVLIGLLGSVGGILLAYPLEAPCGATIVMTCVALFIATLVIGRVRPRGLEKTPG